MEQYKSYFKPKLGSASSSPAILTPASHTQRNQALSAQPVAPPFDIRSNSFDSTRPNLVSKFSSDNLSSKRIVTKAWLQSIKASSSNRSSTASPVTSVDRALVISNPEVHCHGAYLPNNSLGMGARPIGKLSDAFSQTYHYEMPAGSPTVRRSEDSFRSEVSLASSTSSFCNGVRDRALPQLPLRIDSLASRKHSTNTEDVEQLAATPSPPPRTKSRNRSRSNTIDDSLPLGASATSRPSSPAVPALPLQYQLPRNESPKKSLAPFEAFLLHPVPPLSAGEDASKRLVALHIAGKVFSIPPKVLSRHPSKLAEYLGGLPTPSSQQASEYGSTLKPATSCASLLSAYSQTSEPQLASKPAPTSVYVHLPSSPITALRSARASIFNEVPLDEGDEVEEWERQPVPHFLQVPITMAAGSRKTSVSSTNGSISFLDTTPDEECDDPFHFSKEASQPPSLSSSPNSSAFGGDSPTNITAQLSTNRPLDSLVSVISSGTCKTISLCLNRSAEPYESILHYLRESELPRKLHYSSSADLLNGKVDGSLASLVKDLPLNVRPTILPLLLHPTITALQDHRDEAQWLGLSMLASNCERELIMLKGLINASATGPLNQQRMREKTKSPLSSKRAGMIDEKRPKLGHRQFHSEASVPTRHGNSEDGWI